MTVYKALFQGEETVRAGNGLHEERQFLLGSSRGLDARRLENTPRQGNRGTARGLAWGLIGLVNEY